MLRYILILTFSTVFTVGAIAQTSQNLNGLVFNDVSGTPVTDATVSLQQFGKTVKQTTTNRVGRFRLNQISTGNYLLSISHVGYKTYEKRFSVTVGVALEEQFITLEPLVVESQEVVVSAFKATAKTPVTQTNLNQQTIEQEYVGADIPTLISGTPSINSYSESGTGMGYSYFRMRGIDQTRINFTINGVPINDPQNQGFFTNNFADLASSAEAIQIQRGVGTSNNGSAAFGGSVNVTSKNLTEKPEFTFHSGYGSFNSYRNTLEYQTGRLANGKVAFYGRLSDLSSDGYRQNSNSRNRTYFISAGLFGKKSLLKINAWGGVSQSQLAYVGIDKATLESDRTANFLTDAERDEFRQRFYQLQYTYHFNPRLNLSASAYYVKGNAPYFDARFPNSFAFQNMPDTAFRGTDTVTSTSFLNRYRLDQEFIGAYASLNYTTKKLQVNVGIHANSFESDHYMQAIWAPILPVGIEPEHTVYFNTGVKQEMSAFAKASYSIGEKTTLFADVMVRRSTWTYTPKAQQYLFTQYNVEPMEWLFINPKVGARYAVSKKMSFYVMAGATGREPTRFDYLRDDLTYRDIKQDELNPEQVYDVELGTNINTQNLWLNANVYYMAFENQIANTGFTNQFGANITQNSGSGYRAGIEIEGQWNITPRIALTHASNISDNRINSFTQFYSVSDTGGNSLGTLGTTFNNVTPALTPSIIINQGIKYSPTSYLTVVANARYVGKQYIDNTETEALSLEAYTVIDAGLHLNLQQWTGVGEQTLSFRVNNISNTLYSPHGAIGAFVNTQTQDAQGNRTVTTPAAYFPAATTNFFVTLMMKF
jgi:iron complex outermembrane receptor protein